MANSKLLGKTIKIPFNLILNLKKVFSGYTGSKKNVGCVTVRNIINNPIVTYENAKKIINTYEKAINNPKDQLITTLFNPIIDYLYKQLDIRRTGIKNVKKGLSTVKDNAYLAPHNKTRGNTTDVERLTENKKTIYFLTEETFKKIKSILYE